MLLGVESDVSPSDAEISRGHLPCPGPELNDLAPGWLAISVHL